MDPTRNEPGFASEGEQLDAAQPGDTAQPANALPAEPPLLAPETQVPFAAHGASVPGALDHDTASHDGRVSSGPESTFVDDSKRPTFLFFGVVAAVSLFLDISTKVWAEVVLNERGFEPIKIVGDNLAITLAYNQGGAWGLFSSADPMVRKPFFLLVSAFAVFFIISLYSRLHPTQRALKWGLPLVLGGALGNLSDRITRSQVIDFIDYHADWVMQLNSFVHKYVSSWAVTDHWPTFNVADIAICIGVGLMAVDMFTHRPRSRAHSLPPPANQPPSSLPPGAPPEAPQAAL